MKPDQNILSHVIWLGGAADSGKTTLAKWIATRKDYQYYSSDETGAAHLRKLAQLNPKHSQYIESVFAEQWAGYTAEEIAAHSMEIAQARFQFVVADLRRLPNSKPIIAEGTGFTPKAVHAVMSSPYQGLWLASTIAVMEKSFEKKARYLKSKLGQQADATIELLLQANKYLMERIESQAKQYGYHMYEIDEKRSIDENAASVWAHFSLYMTADHQKSA